MWHGVTNDSGGIIMSNTISVMFGSLEQRTILQWQKTTTVFVSGIPAMSMRVCDKARRFITLVDELYNHHCCLFCSAASSIDDTLFQGPEEGALFDLESFQFETEMEGTKLRRDVLAEGSVGSGAAPAGITSLLSGQEEMFAFRRALFAYDTVNKCLSPNPGEQAKFPIPPSLVAGACAGVSLTLVTYPLELLKTRLTIQRGVYEGLFNAFVKILQEGGVPELYRGLTPSLIGVVPYAATNYFAYDKLSSKRKLET